MKLAIGLATRGRPQLLLNTVARTRENIRHPDTEFLIAVDADDQPTIDVLKQLEPIWGSPRLIVSIEARPDTIAAKWNRVLAIPADVYLPMCDDAPILTPGFDEKILAAADLFPDRIGVVFNHLENLSFTSIQAVTRRLVDLMGGVIYVEHFPYWFVDHWLSDIAEMIDRIAFADVLLDCSTNRPPTQELRDPAWWATFYDACRLRRHATARRIMFDPDFIGEAWRIEMQIARFPLIDGYSKLINDGVRSMQGSEPPKDERYLRAKFAAQALLRDEILPELERASAA